ncbi:MAG: SDR family oxidoreductase [Synechococcus sp.]
MATKVAVSGASGKTGFRIVEELLQRQLEPRLLLQPSSIIPSSLIGVDHRRVQLSDQAGLEASLQGIDALVIATGARPSVDLSGPMRVDAWGVKRQVIACQRMGVSRVILVSSLCAGRLRHPLNLFGLILLWKRVGEQALERSGLDWTVIRPGGLSERESELDQEGVLWTGPDQQDSASIPRRLVARCCVEALETPESIGRILEVTSGAEHPVTSLRQRLDVLGKKTH